MPMVSRIERPTLEQLDQEIARIEYNKRYLSVLRSTVSMLIVVVAIATIGANYFFSLIRVEGSSMSPALKQGNLLLVRRTEQFQIGDIIAFYYNNKLLLKRVIADPGDWIEIDEEGNVFVNSELLEETYVGEEKTEKGDIEYPYQVPESQWFVMGDHRITSLDCRYTEVGNVTKEQVFGKVIFCIWPLPWLEKESTS